MKKLAKIILVGSLFFTGTTLAQNTGETSVSVKQETKTKKFKPTKKMVALNVLQKEFKIKTGQQCYYTGSVHGSVGNTISVWSEGNGLKLSKTYFDYNNPKKSNMSGGDGGMKTFVFDSIKKGTYFVIVEESFRGDVQHTYKIKVIVE
jgi:hypothetical protein